jgi:quercetin dioxygenase-like cupin family protein
VCNELADGEQMDVRMRRLITGIDVNGRSCVVSQDDLAMSPVGSDFRIGIPFATDTAPPVARPRGSADLIDQALAPGLVRWMVVEYGADACTPMHHTDTLDLETVLSGSVDLVLDDGAHHLEAGDLVVMTGIDHAWKAGPDGCTINVILVGTPPRDF